jgi:zinc transport system permease protein
MLWRRYTNFADGLAHASIMAAVISSLLGVNILFAGIINGFLFISLIYLLKSKIDNNLIVTISSIFIVSLALILKSIYQLDISLEKALFGDIALSDYSDLLCIAILAVATYILVFLNFNSIILLILNKDLAISKGINIRLIEGLLLFIVSLTIGICIKLMGSLMIFGIIIIPPTIARLFSKSPKEMIVKTIIISVITCSISFFLSLFTEIRISPILICLNFCIFIISRLRIQFYK